MFGVKLTACCTLALVWIGAQRRGSLWQTDFTHVHLEDPQSLADILLQGSWCTNNQSGDCAWVPIIFLNEAEGWLCSPQKVIAIQRADRCWKQDFCPVSMGCVVRGKLTSAAFKKMQFLRLPAWHLSTVLVSHQKKKHSPLCTSQRWQPSGGWLIICYNKKTHQYGMQ